MRRREGRRPADLERAIHAFFAGGLAVSAGLLAIGLARVLASRSPRPPETPHLGTILAHAATGDPLSWVYLGLLSLMAMPVLRVLLLVAGFARLREWRFAAVAAAVMILLLASVRLGLH